MQYLRKIHPSGYLDRLEKLIEDRLQQGADQEKIDARIWDIFGETWAVMTEMSGFSRYVAKFGIIFIPDSAPSTVTRALRVCGSSPHLMNLK